jgi:hypothetical protein
VPRPGAAGADIAVAARYYSADLMLSGMWRSKVVGRVHAFVPDRGRGSSEPQADGGPGGRQSAAATIHKPPATANPGEASGVINANTPGSHQECDPAHAGIVESAFFREA